MDRSKLKKRVNKLEAQYAKENSMTKTLASGATHWGKGDMYDDYFMVDLKSTIGKTQTTIKITDIEKAYKDAISYSPPKMPVIMCDISGYKFYVLREGEFEYFRELVERDNNA